MTVDAPKIPNVEWRMGRPRFSPGEPIRRLGYKAEDLKRADGSWMSAGEALDWSIGRAKEIAAKRAQLVAEANRKKPKGAKPVRHAPVVYSLERLFDDWQAMSPRWGAGEEKGRRRQKPYADNTKRDYRQKMKAIARHDEELYTAAVEALDKPILVGLYEELWEERGLATVRGALATISAAISWGIRRGKLRMTINPAMSLGMEMPEPRLRIAEREEIAALYAAADAIGRPEIGDMIALGVWTGQRQSDRLALVEQESRLFAGRRVFVQQKTGAIVSVVEAPELKARLQAAARRREKHQMELARDKQVFGWSDPHVVLDERQWQPFKKDHYRHLYAEVRAVAVAGIEGKLAPCPSLADFRDQDLRDTAVTWMALGEATIPQIISVTGHTAESAHTILKHYLARHPELADAAIGKMVQWFEKGVQA